MAVSLPIDFRVAEDAIHGWFAGAVELTTIWRNQNAPQPAYPFASLYVIAGPLKPGGQDEIRESSDTKVSDVKITPVAANATTYTVRVNTTDFAFLSDASATVAEITAGLASAINLGAEPVTATDNGTDLDVVHDTAGIFDLVLSDDGGGDDLLSYVNNDLGHEALQIVAGLREMTVSCQVHVGKEDVADPENHSRALMTAAQASLGLPSVLQGLRTAGLSVIDEGPVLTLDELVEDARISRAGMDVRFGLASNLEERTGLLETVAISSDLGLPASLELDDEIIGA